MLHFFMLLVMLLVTACGGSEDALDKGAPMGISVTDALKSDCPNGGAVINQGVDTNGNGEIDTSEVTSSETVCNGVNGTNGTNGTSNKITKTYFCTGDLGTTGLTVTYDLNIFATGDLFVAGSVYGLAVEVGASTMYASGQVGADIAAVLFTYDTLGTVNGGFWKMSLNRTTLISMIEYFDSDAIGGKLSWSMPASDCIVNNY